MKDNLPPKKRLPRKSKKSLNKAFGKMAYRSWKNNCRKVYIAKCTRKWTISFYYDNDVDFTRVSFIRNREYEVVYSDNLYQVEGFPVGGSVGREVFCRHFKIINVIYKQQKL